MGLLLVGFGLKDSIMAIGDRQFGEVRIFSGTLAMEDDAAQDQMNTVMNAVQADSRITDTMRGTRIQRGCRLRQDGEIRLPGSGGAERKTGGFYSAEEPDHR